MSTDGVSTDGVPHQTVRDAIRMARLLGGPPHAATVEQALALAAPHQPPPDSQRVDAIRTLAPDPARRELVKAVAPALESVFLPALRDRVAAVIDGLEDQPPAAVCAEAFAALRDLLVHPVPRPCVLAMQKGIAEAVQRRAAACTEELARLLAGDDDDFPDVAALSNDLLKLEALRWITEILGDARATGEIAHLSRRLARVTLARAAATVERFLKGRDLLNLYDNAAVVSQVDNLIVVAARVLDARAAGEEERTAFVEIADQQALLDFLDSLARLSEALSTLAVKAAGRPGGDVFFTSLVRQMECLYRFSRFIDHAERPLKLAEIEAGLRRRLKAVARIVMDSLDEAVDAGRDAPGALARVEELGAALVRAGMEDEVRTLLLRARVGRKALGTDG